MARWDLSLPKTNIYVSSEELLVHSNEEEVIARHKLDGIKRVKIQKRFEPIALLFAAIGFGLSYFPLFYAESQLLRWILVGLGIACLVLAIFGAIGTKLVLVTKNGEISYTVNDIEEHARGFVVTLTEILAERKIVDKAVKEQISGSTRTSSQELLQ